MRIAGSWFYNKKKRGRLIWVTAGMACMAAGCCAAFYMQVSLRAPTEVREAMAMDESVKKVAITFDDGPNPDYTEMLLSAIPIADPDLSAARKRIRLEGEVPSPLNPPSGCPFRTRCPKAYQACRESMPPLREVAPGHFAACHNA